MPGRPVTRYDYDRYGFLTLIAQSGAGETRLRHSLRGNLLEKRDASGGVTRYFWDMKDRLAAMQTPEGQEIRVEYNREDEPVRYTDEDGRETRFIYNATGMVTACRTPDGTQTGYEYDPEDRLLAVINQNGERWALARDALGRVVTETDYWAQATRYEWDKGDRLIRRLDPLGREVRYGYDALGRRVFKQTPDETRWFYWQGDALAGETVTRTTASLAPLSLFDTGGRIKREQAQSALFHRMREYVYYPGTFRPLALLTQEGSLRESWHYHCDPNGAPVRLTSVCGEIVWAERTGAWGEKGQVFACRIDNPLHFQGQYFDPETGLHYNRYRYYDPAIAAYISQDPIGMLGGGNPYRYAPNPLMWIDPLGLIRGPSTLPDEPGVYIIHAGGKSYVGSAGIKQQGMLSRVSSPEHAKAQRLLSQPDVKVQYIRVHLDDSLTESERNNILRYFEQREFDKEVKTVGINNMLNDKGSRIQAKRKRSYALSLISENKIRSSSRRTTCKKS